MSRESDTNGDEMTGRGSILVLPVISIALHLMPEAPAICTLLSEADYDSTRVDSELLRQILANRYGIVTKSDGSGRRLIAASPDDVLRKGFAILCEELRQHGELEVRGPAVLSEDATRVIRVRLLNGDFLYFSCSREPAGYQISYQSAPSDGEGRILVGTLVWPQTLSSLGSE